MKNYRFIPPALIALSIAFLPATAVQSTAGQTAGGDPKAAGYRAWVEQIKQAPRGPFTRLRWFCNDGTVHPPSPYPCTNRGGGKQHGEWTDQVKVMRDNGYYIANVLADIDPRTFTGPAADREQLSQIVIERFLMQAAEGWVFRGAYGYRGALQAEDEEAGAQALVMAMLTDPAWRDPSRFLLLREAVRALPLQTDDISATAVRQEALDVAEKDPAFNKMRIKSPGSPDAADAAAVREYASTQGKSELAPEYAHLADMIDELYSEGAAADSLERLAENTEDAKLAAELRAYAGQLDAATDDSGRLRAGAANMYLLRKHFQAGSTPADGLVILSASLALERETYTAGASLMSQLGATTRRGQLTWMANGLLGVYGAGLISKRELDSALGALQQLDYAQPLTLKAYRDQLRYLGRIPEWAAGQMRFNFSLAENRLAAIEPLAHMYAQDRLRASSLLICTAVADSLERDANTLAGIEHSLFGKRVGTGLRALNPGLARGPLYTPQAGQQPDAVDSDGVYLLPETTSDLPRVGGILTQGEGNSLSHVQLLARNLGIPNVVVGNSILGQVRDRLGRRVVMAVSPNGVVQLEDDNSDWDSVFGASVSTDHAVVIKPDLDKLDLSVTEFIPLGQLRAADSGRVSGPKGANLGELKHHFGDRVPDGFVIPFGVFRQLLNRPLEKGGPSVYDWMKSEYDAIDALAGDPAGNPAAERKRVRAFLGRLQTWIANVDPGDAFRSKLRAALDARFGPGDGYGVFVRSDTNVEDLPGFTGAGLNETIPNVVGFDRIAAAVQEVWASPFTERAYGWRQQNMTQPEYVFPAVVVQYSFPAQKSGVMVTTDLLGGGNDWLSVAASEGVGGAVDGQAAESLRIPADGRPARLLAQATSPTMRVLSPDGGIVTVPASGTDAVLRDAEIVQLVSLAAEVPRKIEELRDRKGRPIPADIEFAFRDGRMKLLQIRPFVESKSANANQYLISLDSNFRKNENSTVDLAEPTAGAAPGEAPGPASGAARGPARGAVR